MNIRSLPPHYGQNCLLYHHITGMCHMWETQGTDGWNTLPFIENITVQLG